MTQKITKTVTQRGHSKAPANLQFWIDLVNADFGRKLPLSEPLDRLVRAFSAGEDAQSFKGESIRLNSIIAASLSATARRFIGPPEHDSEFSDRYSQLIAAREMLTTIVEWSGANREGRTRRFSVPISIRVNEQGLLETPIDDPLLSALVGVQLNRVRACKVCGHIFWAARQNSDCCSTRCRKKLNKRNSRANAGKKLNRGTKPRQ